MIKIAGKKKFKIGRQAFLIIFIILISTIYVLRLFQWQVIEGDYWAAVAQQQTTDYIKLSAARGEILDKDGNVLVGNKTTYKVKFNYLTMDSDNRNQAIIKILNLLIERNEEWIDNFPIVLDEDGNYVFNEDLENEIKYLKSKKLLNLQEYATAQDCVDAMIKTYGCAGYSNVDTRNLLSVRYSMSKLGFGKTVQYVIADDVSAETVAVINERSDEMPGVETDMGVIRTYGEDGTLAPNIIGYTGALTESDIEKIKEEGNTFSEKNLSGYSLDDTIGATGLESAFESELRGTSGKEVIITDNDGNVTGSEVTVIPKAGNTVVTTIDSGMQKVLNDALAENIINNYESPDAKAGAAVVLNVKDFGVLAASSYPTYDVGEFVSDSAYRSKIVADEDNLPMFDRALQGTFPPGSTFKPFVALAALNEGTISSSTSVYCSGRYLGFTDGYKPKCTGNHEHTNVYTALSKSCNVFFFQTGRDLGIDTMNAYTEYFALGTKTGIELPEAKGQMTNPADYEINHGVSMTEGNTVQAAIGQADDRFTPIQLATYTATIANNGVRLRTHFVDKIVSYDGSEVIKEYEPEIMSDADLSSSALDIVKTGMRQCAESGTANRIFSDYPIKICAKTGTAENANKPDTISFIAYAPANDPEIAISVVMEYAKGQEDKYAMNVAKAAFDYYFGYDKDSADKDTDSPDSATDSPDDGNSDSSQNSSPDSSSGERTSSRSENHGAFYNPDKRVSSKDEEGSSVSDEDNMVSGNSIPEDS